ncbi:hypothetical protein KCQ_04726, partial [Pectobacterium atrosepticum ICMP 1526]|uniref:hypothetical protein n=1 Tax=Pectobacterium atrosepticum TaxID=29471 RepID=UPI00065CF36B
LALHISRRHEKPAIKFSRESDLKNSSQLLFIKNKDLILQNYSEMKGYKKLEFRVIPTLVDSLSSFFCARIKYTSSPMNYLKDKYDLDVSLFPNRGVYIIDDEKTVILGKFIENKTVKYVFSIEIMGVNLSYVPSFLNSLEAVIARKLSNNTCLQLAEDYFFLVISY